MQETEPPKFQLDIKYVNQNDLNLETVKKFTILIHFK